MGDAVRHVSEQELLAAAHADAAHDDDVRLLPADGFDDRLSRVLGDDDRGAAALSRQLARVLGQFAGGLGEDSVVGEQDPEQQ